MEINIKEESYECMYLFMMMVTNKLSCLIFNQDYFFASEKFYANPTVVVRSIPVVDR
jgi:hypothetical protein